MYQKDNMRIIPAYRLKSQLLGDDDIEEYVNDILRVIEDDMRTAIEDEKTFSKTEIPTTFAVSGMTNCRAQKHIYYHVLHALKQGKYDAKIDISSKIYIHVTWINEDDREFETYMDQFISEHLLKASAIPIDVQPQSKSTARRRKHKK